MVLSRQVDGNLWQQLRKGMRRLRHARGEALAAGPAGGQARTGRGASQGRTPRHGLAGRARVRPGPGGGGPAGAAWGGLGLPPPAPALLPFGSRATRGGQGGASSPVPCREAERRSAAGPRPSRLAHAHTTSGGTEGARCSARGSPHRHPVTLRHPASPRVTAGSLSARAHSPWFWAPRSGRRHRGSLAPWPVGASFILFFGSF